MGIVGRKPGTVDAGVGAMLAGRARATIVGSVASAQWVTRLGVRCGRNTSTPAQVAIGVYKATSTVVGAKVKETPLFPVSVFMDDSDAAGGTDYTQPVTGLLLEPNQIYAFAIRAMVAGISHGQDMTGAPMHFRTANSFPDPYGASSVTPEGRMSVWAETAANRAPSTPTVSSPAANAVITDTTPTIRVNFADPDTPYGDYMRWYKIEIWDANNATRIQATGQVATTSGQQAAGYVDWTAGALTTGRKYTIRANTYDAAGVVSPTRTQTFTLNAGGSFSGWPKVLNLETFLNTEGESSIEGAYVLDSTTTPTIRVTWQHSTGEHMTSLSVLARRRDTNDVIRATRTVTLDLASGATADILWTDGSPAWAALSRAEIPIWFEVTALDALGGVSATGYSETFVMNPRPDAASSPSPVTNFTVAYPPTLRWTVADVNNGAQFLLNKVSLTKAGGSPVAYSSDAMNYVGNGVWELPLSGTDFPGGYGDYSWQVLTWDRYGDESIATASPVWTFHYVAPPALAITSPTNGSTIATSTPTITWTLDRTQARRRLTLTRPGFQYTTNWVATTATSVTLPGLLLHNDLSYTLTLEIEAADGLGASTEVTFTVQYPQPSAPTGVTLAAVMSSDFDWGGASYPPQYPNLLLSWDRVDEATVSNEDWEGYNVTRNTAGEEELAWKIMDRNQTSFVDSSCENGKAYTYAVSFSQRINSGFDTIQSLEAVIDGSPVILYPTLTSDDPTDPAVTMHFFTDLKDRPVTAHEEVPGWGTLPYLFQGPLFQETIAGTFRAMTDDTGNNRFTAQDIANAVKELQRPLVLQNGKKVPRTLNYRDDQIAIPGVSVRDFQKVYEHTDLTTTFSILLTQHA